MRFGVAYVSNFLTVVVVSAAVLLYVPQGWAEGRQCADLFDSSIVGILKSAPSAVWAPLTPEMRVILRQHPIWARYHQAGLSEKLFFEFPRRISTVNQILRENEIIGGFKGESIQTHFIAQTLREIFPHAHFYQSKAGRKRVQIEANDYAEHELPDLKSFKIMLHERFATYNQIGMPLLKMANGRTASVSKEELRDRIQISAKKKIFNLYNFDLSTIDLAEFIDGLQSSGQPLDQLVLIASFRHETMQTSYSINQMNLKLAGRATLHLLSELKPGDLEGPGAHLIVNDTKGLLPILHRLSDVTIVGGPVNLFEGLNAGTPTLFSTKIASAGMGAEVVYDKKTFELLKMTALKSGGAYAYETLPELLKQIPLALNNQNAPTPSYLISENGKTWFEHYLDSLQEILDKELATLQRPTH